MNEGSQKKVVLRQVAERAGVSLGTASNVFAGKAGVAVKTRDVVLRAANELGYQPAPHDVSTERTPIHTVGFLLRSSVLQPLSLNPFYSRVLYGVEQACAERGISLLYANMREDVEGVEQMPLMIQRKQVQGILVVGYFGSAFFAALQQTELPFVMIDHASDTLQADSVVSDNERGGYLATRYLIEHVLRPTLATILGLQDHVSFRDRLRGYRRALTEYGISYDEQYVRQGDTGFQGGYTGMQSLLDLERPPTAVFCCNDMAGIGALRALHERGVAVPDACSVVAFDDIDMSAQTVPALTTVRVDKELLGAEGVRLLLERIVHPEMTARHTTIAVQLVERNSVQKHPGP